jgi:hypothetical protein
VPLDSPAREPMPRAERGRLGARTELAANLREWDRLIDALTTTFDVVATCPPMRNLTSLWVSNAGIAAQLVNDLDAASRAEACGNLKAEAGNLASYRALLRAQSGKAITDTNAQMLITFSYAL